MNGTMSSLGQGNSVPAEAWESTMVEALSLVHKQSLRMRMEFWIEALLNDQSREMALYVLAEDNGIHQELGPVLARSPVTMQIIFEEMFSAYSRLRSPVLLDTICERASHALILLKHVASHPNTRLLLLDAPVIHCMTAFLETTDCTRPYELLRFSCLGVISALVQDEDEGIVECLLKTKLFPRILSCLERGPEFTKTVAVFIIFRIMLHDSGLRYCCTIPDRFSVINRSLSIIANDSGSEPHPLLLSCVIGCYLRLSKHPRACDGLTIWLPERLRTFAWTARFHDDPEVVEWARQLHANAANGHYNYPTLI